jgi:CHAD domain-containing protein
LKKYARRQVYSRIERCVSQITKAAVNMDETSVHDLRVSIRRLTAALRLFADLLGKKECRKIRKSLKPLMQRAAEVRDRDIALQLCAEAGLNETSPTVQLVLRQRQEAAVLLTRKISRMQADKLASRWKEKVA